MGIFDKSINDALSKLLTPRITAAVPKAIKTSLPSSAEKLDKLVEDRLGKIKTRVIARELGLPAPTVYRDVFEFVDHVVLDLYATEISNQNGWCSKWYAHGGAQRRLTLMWVTWEKARIEEPATGEEGWMRTIGDYHMAFLMGSRGPFAACNRMEHRPDTPLPSEPIPLPSANEDHHDSESEK